MDKHFQAFVADEASLIKESFIEGFSDGWHLFWAIVSAPVRMPWAFIRGKPQVSYTLRTH